ncbi:hypothetical protein, partial [uncultured Desulfovibrio sp.]|uniref:hypothetical protein n=1 Tax=uncultured Desulfovibrio sp. TaxID=167968 RepID=UPI002633AC0E
MSVKTECQIIFQMPSVLLNIFSKNRRHIAALAEIFTATLFLVDLVPEQEQLLRGVFFKGFAHGAKIAKPDTQPFFCGGLHRIHGIDFCAGIRVLR